MRSAATRRATSPCGRARRTAACSPGRSRSRRPARSAPRRSDPVDLSFLIGIVVGIVLALVGIGFSELLLADRRRRTWEVERMPEGWRRETWRQHRNDTDVER